MLDLDLSVLAPETAALLIQRGSGLPPLCWDSRPNPLGKRTLDEIEDSALFGRRTLEDEPSGAAIRALLYLWSGWPNEARMYAQAANDDERHFITGVCERHGGHANAAKAAFQQLDGHPVFDELAGLVPEIVADNRDRSICRFAEIVRLTECWEPFAFVDLYEQGRAGVLTESTLETVRTLQCREFEVLFRHCHRRALGAAAEAAPAPAPVTSPRRKRRVERRRQPTRSVPAAAQPAPARSQTRPQAEPQAKSRTSPALPPAMVIGVKCPKCATLKTVPKTTRGKCIRCPACGTGFLVPPAKPRGEGAPPVDQALPY